jgi:hypothetical protein
MQERVSKTDSGGGSEMGGSLLTEVRCLAHKKNGGGSTVRYRIE